MEYQNLIFECCNGIGVLTINRPKAMNALNSVTLSELCSFCAIDAKDNAVKAIIITGAGSKAFVAGADIEEMRLMNEEQAVKFSKWGHHVFNMIEQIPKPVIAAVNGFALGGGCELSMACDIRIASDKSKFGQPEVNLGIIAGYGGTQRLPQLVGKGRANELLFTGDVIDADEAFRIGLVNKVVPTEELMTAARAMADKIISRAPIAVQLTKSVIARGLDLDLKSGLNVEAAAFGNCFGTADQKEGMAAFLEKRAADFSGK